MKRVVLVHRNAEEAAGRAARLRQAGYDVSCHSDPRADPRSLRGDPPDAFVIDLERIPSQGREIGGWLRRQKVTRNVPLVFIEGDPEKTARVRVLLPDATFTTWERIVADLSAAIVAPHRNRPADDRDDGGRRDTGGGLASSVPWQTVRPTNARHQE